MKTPKGEWNLRTILESVQRTLPTGYFPFTTSNVPGRGDALVLGEEIIQEDGRKVHGKQSTKNHDAYMMKKAWEEGFRTWRFWDDEILYCTSQVQQILISIAMMKRILLERKPK